MLNLEKSFIAFSCVLWWFGWVFVFAVGHLAIGYLLGRGFSKFAGVEVKLPLIFTATIIPDVDLLLPINHRGPTHSLIVQTLFMLPFLAYYRKKALPYYIALLSHALVGDLMSESSALLWPVYRGTVGGSIVSMSDPTIILIEVLGFLVSLIFMYKLKDIKRLLTTGPSSLTLIIPMGALFVPLAITEPYLLMVLPPILIMPSITYLILFAISIPTGLYIYLKKYHKKTHQEVHTHY